MYYESTAVQKGVGVAGRFPARSKISQSIPNQPFGTRGVVAALQGGGNIVICLI